MVDDDLDEDEPDIDDSTQRDALIGPSEIDDDEADSDFDDDDDDEEEDEAVVASPRLSGR